MRRMSGLSRQIPPKQQTTAAPHNGEIQHTTCDDHDLAHRAVQWTHMSNRIRASSALMTSDLTKLLLSAISAVRRNRMTLYSSTCTTHRHARPRTCTSPNVHSRDRHHDNNEEGQNEILSFSEFAMADLHQHLSELVHLRRKLRLRLQLLHLTAWHGSVAERGLPLAMSARGHNASAARTRGLTPNYMHSS